MVIFLHFKFSLFNFYSVLFFFLYRTNKFFFTDDEFASEICQLRMKPNDFNLIKVIGRGAFGEVQLVCSIFFLMPLFITFYTIILNYLQ